MRAYECRPIVLVTAVMLAAGAARADESCAAVVISVGASLGAEWVEAARALREELARSSACAAATLALTPAARGAVLVVTTADGRTTRRDIASPRALAPVALGLLAALPPDAAPPSSAPPSSAPQPAAAPAPSSAPSPAPSPAASTSMRIIDPADAPPRDSPPRVSSSTAPRFVLGVGLGGRLGEPTRVVMGEIEARVDLVVGDGWLVFGAARAALGGRVAGAHIDGYAYDEYAFAVGAGRRVHVGGGAIDFTVAPTLVIVDEEGGPSGVPGDTASGGLDYLRVEGAARCLFAKTEGWRFGVTVGLDVAPFDVTSAPRVDVPLPALPTWTTFARATAVGELL